MASVKLEIKGERSVVAMILDNVPSFRGSIPREVRIFFKQNLKFEVRSMLKGVKEVLKRSNSSHREETCYVEALFYF